MTALQVYDYYKVVGIAWAGFICGILSIISFVSLPFLLYMGIVLGPLAPVLSGIALSRLESGPARNLAIIGLILGILTTLSAYGLWLLLFIGFPG